MKTKTRRKNKKLSESDIAFMLENRTTMPVNEIAKKINRPGPTVRAYFNRNNLDIYTVLDDDGKKYIDDNYFFKTYKEIADDLNVKVYVIRNYCSRHNLVKRIRPTYSKPENIKPLSWAAKIHQEIKKVAI
jgi:hypothetical protein